MSAYALSTSSSTIHGGRTSRTLTHAVAASRAVRRGPVLAPNRPLPHHASSIGQKRRGGVAVAAAEAAEVITKKKVFIDGEAGTTGLQVRDRLAARSDIEIISLFGDDRKDAAKRAEFLNAADVAILCLPDDAAIEAVALVTNPNTVIIDASTAHRVDPTWAYGFPELCPGQKEIVASSKRITNPGCYPTGMIALTRPLVDAGLLPEGTGLVVHAVSGYSGGGKALMKIHEDGEAEPWGAYGFNLKHKHLPEMAEYSKVGKAPVFCPAVGSFEQGMVVSVPLHYAQLAPAGRSAAAIQRCLEERYAGSTFVSVRPLNKTEDLERGGFLRPDSLNGTNALELSVFASDEQEQVWLCARLDNLGKGASGAAVQNMNLALGLPEDSGL